MRNLGEGEEIEQASFLNHQIFDINKKANLENRETYTKKSECET